MEIKITKNTEEIQKCLDIRKRVFCGEQGVSKEVEHDEYDKAEKVEHVIIIENGKIIGCARIRPVENKIKLERIVILQKQRGKGYGKALVEWITGYAKSQNPKEVYMNAQYRLKGFYESLWFEAIGETFEEGGIEHIKMIYKN